ncbi:MULTISPECIES: asparagine synthase-related protein [unclassified Cupriavidus]|uniref:asparagine synthase-related protein n=1 Tax=unclassified Cupriavidus TaxID=2640874 RepID=UPI00313BEEFB
MLHVGANDMVRLRRDGPAIMIEGPLPPGPSVVSKPMVTVSEPSDFEIAIPEGSGRLLYVMSEGASVYVSQSLERIAHAAPLVLRPLSAVRFIENRNGLHETLFAGLRSFPAGTTVRYINGTISVAWAYDSLRDTTRQNPAEVLQDIVASVESDALVGIDFSGGLDSTAILHAVRALAARRLVACTWHDPHGSAPDDLEWAQRIAKQLKVEHIVVPIDDRLLLNVPSRSIPGMPTSALAFRGVMDNRQEALRSHFRGAPFSTINGHGGDQVFLDPVPAEVLLSILRRTPSKTASAWRAYRSLYGIDPLRVMWHAYGRAVHRSALLSAYARALQPLAREGGAKLHRRHALIREAIVQNSASFHGDGEVRTIHPFTDTRMIRCALAYQDHELFNAEHSRHPLRRGLEQRYGHCDFFRKGKGHMTGAYQRAIRSRESDFRDMIAHGRLAGEGLINIEAAHRALRRCAMGYAGVPHDLMTLLCAELLLKALENLKHA